VWIRPRLRLSTRQRGYPICTPPLKARARSLHWEPGYCDDTRENLVITAMVRSTTLLSDSRCLLCTLAACRPRRPSTSGTPQTRATVLPAAPLPLAAFSSAYDAVSTPLLHTHKGAMSPLGLQPPACITHLHTSRVALTRAQLSGPCFRVHQATYLLFEAASGYALFDLLDVDSIAAVTDPRVQESVKCVWDTSDLNNRATSPWKALTRPCLFFLDQ